MFKILVVDDEKIVRIGLKTIIKWEENGFELVGEAKDGVSALEIVRQYDPDIIITDLKMPGMDGIELIKTLKKNEFRGKILVLSNYGEFELVRDAMKYGASDYLLKVTMGTGDLVKILKQFSEELSRDRESNEKTKRIEIELIENMEIAVNRFFKEIFEERTSDSEDFLIKANRMGIEIDQYESILFYLVIDRFEDARSKGKIKNLKLFKQSVINIIKEIASDKAGMYVLDISHREFVVIIPADLCKSSYKFAQSIIEMIKIYLNLTASIVISTKFTGIRFLNERLTSCKQAVNMKFYNNKETVILADEAVFNNNIFWCGYKNSAADVKKFVSIGEIKSAEEFFYDVLETAKSQKIWPEALKEFVMIIINDLDGLFLQWGMENILQFTQYKAELMETETLEEFREKLFKLLYVIYEKLCQLKTGVYRKEVRRVIDYINNHISDKISLEMIAKDVRFSEGYLCRMFKNETGKNLVNLINELKMQKAQEMLEKPDMIVKEVATSVGIDDQFYFNRIFKKYVGISPSEYKKKVLGK